MKASSISNPIMRQIEQIVQKVNNKAQSDVQHIRQSRKDSVVISAQSLYMAEEAKKMKEAQQPTDSQPVKKADPLEEGYAKRARDGYINRYAHLYDTGNKLRDIKDYCDEAKRYTDLASRTDIKGVTDEDREMCLKAAEEIRQYCSELARQYGEDVLITAGFERCEAAKIKKKSAFEGINEESLGLHNLSNNSIDEILEAIDKAIPMIEKAAENVNSANMIEYNEDLSKYRPDYRPKEKNDIIDYFKSKLSNVFTSYSNYEDVKVVSEESHSFNAESKIEHRESITVEEYNKQKHYMRQFNPFI